MRLLLVGLRKRERLFSCGGIGAVVIISRELPPFNKLELGLTTESAARKRLSFSEDDEVAQIIT